MLELKITANNPQEIMQVFAVLTALSSAQRPAPPAPANSTEAASSEPNVEAQSEDAPKKRGRPKKAEAQPEPAATATTEPPEPTVEEPAAEPALTYDQVKAALLEHGQSIKTKVNHPDAYPDEIRAIMVAADVPNKPNGAPGVSMIGEANFAPMMKIIGALSAAFAEFSGDKAAWDKKRTAVIGEVLS